MDTWSDGLHAMSGQGRGEPVAVEICPQPAAFGVADPGQAVCARRRHRLLDRSEPHQVWLGIAGLLLVVIGVILIRHLNLTVALVGLVIGVTWIVHGLASLAIAFSGGTGERRGWWIFFGLISLIAGIVVVAVPTTTVLAVLVGIWFIAEGLVEIVGGFMQRHADSKSQASHGQPAPNW